MVDRKVVVVDAKREDTIDWFVVAGLAKAMKIAAAAAAAAAETAAGDDGSRSGRAIIATV